MLARFSYFLPDQGRHSWPKVSAIQINIDGRLAKDLKGNSCGGGIFGGFDQSVPSGVPGNHQVQFVARIQIFAAPNSTLLYQFNRTLSASFEVLASKPNGLMKPMSDPRLAAAVRAAVNLESLDSYAGDLEGSVSIKSPPVNLAFDVFVRYGGAEYQVGEVTGSAGEDTDIMFSGRPKEPVPGAVDVILRPSEKAARGTVDMYTYWNQELVYTNVPVH